MYYIWGKNTNHLFKNNHKKTYSLPQKMLFPLQASIHKLSCGQDFVIILTNDGKVYFHYQSAFYIANDKVFKNNIIIDIGTDDGLMIFITQNGEVYVSEFKHQKIVNGQLKPTKVNLKAALNQISTSKIKQVCMNYGQIFLKLQQEKKEIKQNICNYLIYLKRNSWYQTKTFSDPKVITAPQGKKFTYIYLAEKNNVFLTNQGHIYTSSKKFPCDLQKFKLKENSLKNKTLTQKFTKVQINNQNQWYGITQEGKIFTWKLDKQKQQITDAKQFCKISDKIIDLCVGAQNNFLITESGQGWVWGINANGELGLSDYQERKTIYPLITLQKFFIKNIYIGVTGFTCCIINGQNKRNKNLNQDNLLKQKYSSNFISIQKDPQDKRINQCIKTKQSKKDQKYPHSTAILMKKNPIIQYSDAEQESNENSSFRMNSTQNILFQKNQIIHNKNSFPNQKNLIINKRPISNLQSIGKQEKFFNEKFDKKNNSTQVILKQSGCEKEQKNASYSAKKINTKKPKALFSNKKLNQSNQNVKYSKESLTPIKCSQKKICCLNKTSLEKAQNLNKYDNKSCKSNKSSFSSVMDKNKQLKQNSNLVTPKKNKQHKVVAEFSEERKKYIKKIQALMSQLHSLRLQNTDLTILLKQKQLVIEDVTSKIMLLEQAIQQHQKTLTARDQKMEENYLREKQYQIYIVQLQNQLQDLAKDVKVQICSQKRQNLLYKKQIGKLSQQIKQRILQQKTYYKDKIIQMERLYNSEKGFYQKQINKLKKQIQQYKGLTKQWQKSMINRCINQKILQKKCEYYQNTFEDSPNFQTVEMKQLKQNQQKRYADFIDQQYQNCKSTLLTNHHVLALNQKNFNIPKKMEQNEKSQAHKSNYYKMINKNNFVDRNSQSEFSCLQNNSQVGSIIQNIQKNKNQISKSANKLLSILQKQI